MESKYNPKDESITYTVYGRDSNGNDVSKSFSVEEDNNKVTEVTEVTELPSD